MERRGGRLARAILLTLQAVSLSGCTRSTSFQVPGGGMEPNIASGQAVQLDAAAYRSPADVHRGDVVVFRSPTDPARLFVKRLIGLPGERVKVTRGRVSINGSALPLTPQDDASIEDAGTIKYRVRLASTCSETPEVTIAAETFFALGDNRCASYDSRDFGAVSFSSIRGRVILHEQ
jgi:signal peptidase I